MIAEVDLETVEPAAAGREGFDLDATIAQRLHITVGQGMAADAVVKQIDRHAFSGFFQQQVLQPLAEAIVVNDEELDQDRFFGLADGIKNRIEGRPAIDQ
ncbi:hypothetical protein D3C71_1070270 [compost metagenome]